jgi:hypothetical protein
MSPDDLEVLPSGRDNGLHAAAAKHVDDRDSFDVLEAFGKRNYGFAHPRSLPAAAMRGL